jgi:ATP-dependent DNA helicase PIF1
VGSFAGIGLGKGDPEKVKMKVLRSATACERWSRCKVLIIDEISMLNKVDLCIFNVFVNVNDFTCK